MRGPAICAALVAAACSGRPSDADAKSWQTWIATYSDDGTASATAFVPVGEITRGFMPGLERRVRWGAATPTSVGIRCSMAAIDTCLRAGTLRSEAYDHIPVDSCVVSLHLVGESARQAVTEKCSYDELSAISPESVHESGRLSTLDDGFRIEAIVGHEGRESSCALVRQGIAMDPLLYQMGRVYTLLCAYDGLLIAPSEASVALGNRILYLNEQQEFFRGWIFGQVESAGEDITGGDRETLSRLIRRALADADANGWWRRE